MQREYKWYITSTQFHTSMRSTTRLEFVRSAGNDAKLLVVKKVPRLGFLEKVAPDPVPTLRENKLD